MPDLVRRHHHASRDVACVSIAALARTLTIPFARGFGVASAIMNMRSNPTRPTRAVQSPGSSNVGKLHASLMKGSLACAVSIVCVVGLTGCDKVAQKHVDETGAGSTKATASNTVIPAVPMIPGTPGTSVAAGSLPVGAGQILPLAAGQWARYKTFDNKGGTGEMVYKILAQRGTSYDFEIVTQKDTRTVLQATISIGRREDPQSYKVEAAKLKPPNGAAVDVKPGLVNPMLAPLMSSFSVPALGTQPREDVTVPAGTFPSCLKVEQSYTILGKSFSGTSWVHPSVPVLAAVKTQPNQDSVSRMELIEFGLTGAKSEL